MFAAQAVAGMMWEQEQLIAGLGGDCGTVLASTVPSVYYLSTVCGVQVDLKKEPG